jgi:hypothetical protein
MKRYLVLLAIPMLAACGDSADQSAESTEAETELTTGAPADPADMATPALPDQGLTDPAATNPAPPSATGTGSPADAATVPPTDQDARYQDSVTERPEVVQ